MQVTLEIPDELAAILKSGGHDLSRAALEAIVVEEYRNAKLSDVQFRRLLGLSRVGADELLKAHGVWLDYTLDDFRREGDATQGIGERR